MALIPTWYSASTKQIAEKALQRGVLKYPGLCYIQDSKSIAWVTIDNTLEYVKGDKQITDVKCIGSNLMFFSGDKLLFSYDISMTDEDKGHIIEEVKKTMPLVKIGDKVTKVSVPCYSNPIVKLTNDEETEDDTAAITVYLKRDTNVEADRVSLSRKTDVSADKHYVVALSDQSKVVLARIKK